jgi:DNA-binding MarR family transcriptional regulator
VPPSEIVSVRLQLRRYAMERDRWIGALCRRLGASRSDYDALEALDEHGSMTAGELASLLSLTSGSVTALVGRLEQLGWATRTNHPDDRRKVVIALTQEAWRLGQEELAPYLSAVDAATRRLSAADRRIVRGFLDDLTASVVAAGD